MESPDSIKIKTIKIGGLQCYLLQTGENFFLIDSLYQTAGKKLADELRKERCVPGKLKLVILTHGDEDHAGNALFLREEFGAKIAMHEADRCMVETGDILSSRKKKADFVDFRFKLIGFIAIFIKKEKFRTFSPDILIDENTDLNTYGLPARVIHLPGHSKGSIGILTAEGDLFCGDLIYNMMGPGFMAIDDMPDAKASIAKIKKLAVSNISRARAVFLQSRIF